MQIMQAFKIRWQSMRNIMVIDVGDAQITDDPGETSRDCQLLSDSGIPGIQSVGLDVSNWNTFVKTQLM